MANKDELDIAIESRLCGVDSPLDSASSSALDDEGRELVRLAVYLRDTTPQVCAGSKERTWELVRIKMAESRRQSRLSPRVVWSSVPWLTRVAAVLVGTLLVASVAVGTTAANSLPDTPLYPVKLAMERGQLALAPDASARAKLEMSFAQERLEEVVALDEEGRGVSSIALDAMLLATTRASEHMEIVDDPEQREAVGEELDKLTSHQEIVLSTLLEKAPETAKEGLQRALEASQKAKAKSAGSPSETPKDSQPGLGRGSAPGQEKKSAPAEHVDKSNVGTDERLPRDVPPSDRGRGKDKPAGGSKSHK